MYAVDIIYTSSGNLTSAVNYISLSVNNSPCSYSLVVAPRPYLRRFEMSWRTGIRTIRSRRSPWRHVMVLATIVGQPVVGLSTCSPSGRRLLSVEHARVSLRCTRNALVDVDSFDANVFRRRHLRLALVVIIVGATYILGGVLELGIRGCVMSSSVPN